MIFYRLLSFLIDLFDIYITAYILGWLLNLKDISWIMIFAGCYSIIYFTGFWYKGNGQTIGGRITRIKVESVNGAKINFWKALLRACLVTTIVAPIGVIAILAVMNLVVSIFSVNVGSAKEKCQTVWDISTGTCVRRAVGKFS